MIIVLFVILQNDLPLSAILMLVIPLNVILL